MPDLGAGRERLFRSSRPEHYNQAYVSRRLVTSVFWRSRWRSTVYATAD